MSGRILKINAEIQKAVSEIITYNLKNPLITGIISVMKVETTTDLEYSKIYLSIFTNDNKEDVFNQIKHSAGYIRKELAKRVDLRKVPYLQFYMDKSAEYTDEINNAIKVIHEQRKNIND